MRVGCFQFAPRFGEESKNRETILEGLRDADADLIVLPELPFTGYSFSDRDELSSMAEEPSASASIKALCAICAEKNMHIVTGFAEKAGAMCFNTALLLGPPGIIGKYRKVHLFNAEKYYFDRGDLPFPVFSIGDVKIGLMICFDWIFPEASRVLALKGADIICHPSNLVLCYCQKTMISRAIENSVFVITANRIGTESRTSGSLTFTGSSQIVGPRGEVLHSAPADTAELSTVEINPPDARDKMITETNHVLDDRRPEFYKI